MGQLINIEGIDWIRNVANSLQIIFNELHDVNKLLSNFDDFLQQSGKAREFNYNYKSQRAAIQNLENDLQIYQSCFSSYSLAEYLDALIDHPFYTSLEQAVKELSLAQIDRYSTDSVGRIGSIPNQRITINDVLNTQLSKDMLRLQYEEFLKLVFPWTENLSLVDYQIYYEAFLGYIIGIADFDFKTGKDKTNDFIKKSLYIIGILASGGTLAGALLGKNLIGLKFLTMATTGTSTLMDIITLLSGTDANGNSLTEVELSALGKKVALQASALGISLYLTVSSMKGADTVSTMKGADINFKSKELLESHFSKHGDELKNAFNLNDYSVSQYLSDANHVLKIGTYVEEINGYVQLIGGEGSAKYAFVGLDRVTGEITTFHIKTVSELIKKAPSLGLLK